MTCIMHDAASFEQAGIPSVCMVSSGFAKQAQHQAEVLNLSDIRVSFVRHPVSDATPADMVSKANESFGTAAKAITTDGPVDVPDWVVNNPQGCSTMSGLDELVSDL